MLRRLKAGLPEDSWKAIFFEDLHADKVATLRDLEAFLGIGAHKYPDTLLNKRTNESVSRPMPEFYADLFAGDMLRIRDEVAAEGFAIPADWG